MISLTPLIAHLKPMPQGFDGAWFREVAGAAEYAQVNPASIPAPSAWLVRAADKVDDLGENTDEVVIGFDVVIAIKNAKERKSATTDDALLSYRKAVYALLRGWEIEPDIKPIKFSGGRVLRYSDGDLVWADKYTFDAIVTNYLPDPPAYESTNYTGERL